MSNSVHTTCLWNNLHQVQLKTERLESQTIKSFVSNKTNGPKQDRQNRLRSPTCTPVEENPTLINNYIT
jgi:hypothetical protein